MKISPSIASGNLLNISEEISFIDEYFDAIHLDIEDGVAVNNISFGFKLAKSICDISKSKEKTMHLELINPNKYIDRVRDCNVDVVFIQIDVLDNPINVITSFRQKGICVGINISNLDLLRDNLSEILASSEYVLVNTTHHDDVRQICDMRMIQIAERLANNGKKVWIDGGITWEIFEQIKNSCIHCAVMGRAVFSNKNKIIKTN